MFLGIVVPIALWLLIFIIIGFIFPKYERFKQSVSDMLFCDKSFKFLFETYLILAMCASINFKYNRWDTLGNGFNSWLSIFIMIILVGFPITVGVLYSRPKVFKLVYHRNKEFMKKFGSLIENLNFHRHGPKVFIYLWVTMLRKLWLVHILVF